MSWKIETEQYGNVSSRERVTYGGHLVTFFGNRKSADKFVAYCEQEGITCRRQWIDKARHDVKQNYIFTNWGGADLAVVPFTF